MDAVSDGPRTHRWPTTLSSLGIPGQKVAYLVAAVFVAAGLAVLWGALPDKPFDLGVLWQQDRGRLFAAGFGLVFAALGLLVPVMLILENRRNRPFVHAADDVLPDVPQEPRLAGGQISYILVTHFLEKTPRGLRLTPKPRLFTARDGAVMVWMVLVSAVAMAMLWLAPDALFPAGELPLKIVFSVMFVFGGFGAAGLMIYIGHQAEHGLISLEIDAAEGTCRITGRQETLSIPLQQMAAVQLCAAIRKFGWNEPLADKHTFPAVELNLVWRSEGTDEDGRESHAYQRFTAMNMSGGFYRLVPFARQLANAFGVPLLNHATRRHWQEEFQRSKNRPYRLDGGYV